MRVTPDTSSVSAETKDDQPAKKQRVDEESCLTEKKAGETKESNKPAEPEALPTVSSGTKEQTALDSHNDSFEMDAELEIINGGFPALKAHWSLEERERLFHTISRVFLLNFPLYVAFKHGHSSIEVCTCISTKCFLLLKMFLS